MTLEEVLFELDSILFLNESGPDITLRHYTDWNGFVNILLAYDEKSNKNGIIMGRRYYFAQNNKLAISVIRPSGKIKEIDEISRKKTCGFFEIAYHKANDIVKNLKLVSFNELWKEYNLKIDSIARRYNLNKSDLIANPERYAPPQIRKNDYDNLLSWIYNAKQALIDKEGEDRLLTPSLPLDNRYMKFEFTKSVVKNFEEMPIKWKRRLKVEIINRKSMFKSSIYYQELRDYI